MTQPYGIIGDGRLARHFGHYLELLGCGVRQWSRRLATGGLELSEVLAPCRTVLVLISDDAIEPFLEGNPVMRERTRTVIQCAGGLVTDLAHGMHPLSTFGSDVFDLATYRRVPFVCEPGPPSFRDAFPDLPNPAYVIAREHKPLYHAACVLAGNFTPLMWDKLFRIFRDLGLPREVAEPYLGQVCANLMAGGAYSHTGPLARGDRRTIERHLAALNGDPYRQVYEAIVRAGVPSSTLDDS